MAQGPKLEGIEAITEDDAFIEAALEEAHLPSLMLALVHLTGSTEHLRGEIKPVYEFFGDGQGDLTPEQQQRVRAQALSALAAYRDSADALPPAPSRETIREMMDFIAGDAIPEHYVPFLLEELALEDTDSKAIDWHETIPDETKQAFHVVIIGAGMSGVLAAIRLKQIGIPFTVIEKNKDVGGTWLENSYPGCRVDTPNHLYSFSFEPNHDWPQHYSTQDVLFAYFRRCADKYGIRDRIRFSTTVESAAYDDDSATWTVKVAGADDASEEIRANAVISAVGQLNRPQFPSIEGMESFEGPAFHSGEWDHDVDLAGKRVAVIGTGASAFQFVPEIAETVNEMIVFQRTPPWLGPTPNYHDDVGEGMKWLLQHVPYYEKWYRFWLFWMMTDGIYAAVSVDPAWNDLEHSVSAENQELRTILAGYIEEQLADRPDLAGAAIPPYPPGGKRMLRDNGVWLSALKRDNVHLVTDAITRITSTGIVTSDGTEREIDVIIYGTGFQASRFLHPMKIKGKNGVDLNEQWQGDARAYLGITVPNFPNLFCMYGPNTNIVVNGSIIFFSECEIRYILGCLQLLLEGGHASMDCDQQVHDAFNAKVDERNELMAWGTPHVSSWYKNDKGRVAQNWPFPLVDFWTATREPNPADFHFR